MPQSLVKNYIHITFSTKNRYPFIDDGIESELFCYLGGICKEHECHSLIVGGHKDHIHILCRLSPKVALMRLIEELKTHSSKWIKTKGSHYKNFYWQHGYGAFSVNPAEAYVVKRYISNQRQHHSDKSFKVEYRLFLSENQIDFNEDYVWG